jgi:integrase
MGDRLTKRRADAAKPDPDHPDREVLLWDGDLKGFGLRVTPKGVKSYVIQYRVGGGRGTSKRFTIGKHGSPYTPEAARKRAEELLRQAREGKDPAQARRAASEVPTLRTFSQEYVEKYGKVRKKPRTVAEDERLLKLHILPALGDKKLSQIAPEDAVKFHAGMKGTPVTANRCAALLNHIFNVAAEWGEVPKADNPFRSATRSSSQGIKKYKEEPRDRYLSSQELARLGDALRACEATEPPSAVAGIRLLLLTGARLNEIMTLEWSMVDFEQKCLRLPDSKTGRKQIALGAPVLELLKTLTQEDGNPFVLPGHRGGKHFVGIQHVWQRVRDKAKLPDVRLHDLRHSFASVAVAAGDSLYLVGKVLGHKQAATTERYAHAHGDPVRAVADRVAKRIASAMLGKKPRRASKVVKLVRKVTV